jgi:hypothetical protein
MKCADIYKQLNIDPAQVVDELKEGGIDMSEEYKNMQEQGNFHSQSGNFCTQNHNPDIGDLDFREYSNRTGLFDVINGRLYIHNSAYYWSLQMFDAALNWDVTRYKNELFFCFSPLT